jgi:hypothetical protein
LKLHGFIEKYLVRDYQKNIRCIISVLKCWMLENYKIVNFVSIFI